MAETAKKTAAAGGFSAAAIRKRSESAGPSASAVFLKPDQIAEASHAAGQARYGGIFGAQAEPAAGGGAANADAPEPIADAAPPKIDALIPAGPGDEAGREEGEGAGAAAEIIPPGRSFDGERDRAVENAALTRAAADFISGDDEDAEIQTWSDPKLYVARIKDHWNESRVRYLRIGRLLAYAKRQLKPKQFDKLISEDCPFARSTNYQLRTIWEAVSRGDVREEELPLSYTCAYLLVKRPRDEIEEARSRRLLRPEVARDDVRKFVGELRRREADRIAGNAESSSASANDLSLAHEDAMKRARAAEARRREAEGEVGSALAEARGLAERAAKLGVKLSCDLGEGEAAKVRHVPRGVV